MELLEGMEMEKCKYCGKEYVKNESSYLKNLSKVFRKNLEYLPACDCLEKQKERELKELERKRIKESIEKKMQKCKDISVVDKKFLNSRFENADMNCDHMQLGKKYVENFLKKDKQIGLLFYEGVGTGKTFATACIANYLMERGKTVLVMNLGLYFNKLTEWGDTEKIVLKQAEDCDLLIIDDFGAEKGLDKSQTGWRGEKIYNLIDARYRSEKPLIISTNLNFSEDEIRCELSEKFSTQGKNRIRDRIVDMCFPVEVTGRSRRGMKQEAFIEFML